MSGIISAAAIGAVSLGYGIYKDVKQNSAAKKIEEANKRPVETVDPNYQKNVNTAEQMAQQGIPQASYNNQVNAINQNQAGAINAVSNSANPGANIASIVRQGNAATGNLNAQDAIQRNKNTLALIQQRGILAGANRDVWNYNYADKYSENLAKSQALRGAAAQTEANTINAAGQMGMGLSQYGRMGKMGNAGYPSSNGYGMPIANGFEGDMNYTGQFNNAV